MTVLTKMSSASLLLSPGLGLTLPDFEQYWGFNLKAFI